MVCVPTSPINTINLVKRTDNIYSCGYVQNGQYNPVALLLYLEKFARCVSETICYFGDPNCVRYSPLQHYHSCVSR